MKSDLIYLLSIASAQLHACHSAARREGRIELADAIEAMGFDVAKMIRTAAQTVEVRQ